MARFVGFNNETFCPETEQLTVLFNVTIHGFSSDSRVVTLDNILPFFPSEAEIQQQDVYFLQLRLKAGFESLITFPLNTEWDEAYYLAYQIDLACFLEKYKDRLMCTKIMSELQRCSKNSVLEIFIMEFKSAKACNASSTFALRLPRQYFMREEPGVELREVIGKYVPHTSLKKLE